MLDGKGSAALAGVYTDFSGLAKLRAASANASPRARREAAQQFEALFLQMMLKSMRQTTGGTLLDGPQSEMYRDLYDQQLALHLARKGAIGIGKMVLAELEGKPQRPVSRPLIDFDSVVRDTGARQTATRLGSPTALAERLWGDPPGPEDARAAAGDKGPRAARRAHALPWRNQREFIEHLRPAAEAAAARLGTRPEAILAMAALETGWGRHVMPAADGRPSFNLFGIKADRRWQHGRVFASTLEFEQGVMQRRREPFRTYPDPAASVHDFADFLQANPRYRRALQSAADPERFLAEIHRAGYATDPDYVQKVTSVMQRIQRMTQESGA